MAESLTDILSNVESLSTLQHYLKQTGNPILSDSLQSNISATVHVLQEGLIATFAKNQESRSTRPEYYAPYNLTNEEQIRIEETFPELRFKHGNKYNDHAMAANIRDIIIHLDYEGHKNQRIVEAGAAVDKLLFRSKVFHSCNPILEVRDATRWNNKSTHVLEEVLRCRALKNQSTKDAKRSNNMERFLRERDIPGHCHNYCERCEVKADVLFYHDVVYDVSVKRVIEAMIRHRAPKAVVSMINLGDVVYQCSGTVADVNMEYVVNDTKGWFTTDPSDQAKKPSNLDAKYIHCWFKNSPSNGYTHRFSTVLQWLRLPSAANIRTRLGERNVYFETSHRGPYLRIEIFTYPVTVPLCNAPRVIYTVGPTKMILTATVRDIDATYSDKIFVLDKHTYVALQNWFSRDREFGAFCTYFASVQTRLVINAMSIRKGQRIETERYLTVCAALYVYFVQQVKNADQMIRDMFELVEANAEYNTKFLARVGRLLGLGRLAAAERVISQRPTPLKPDTWHLLVPKRKLQAFPRVSLGRVMVVEPTDYNSLARTLFVETYELPEETIDWESLEASTTEVLDELEGIMKACDALQRLQADQDVIDSAAVDDTTSDVSSADSSLRRSIKPLTPTAPPMPASLQEQYRSLPVPPPNYSPPVPTAPAFVAEPPSYADAVTASSQHVIEPDQVIELPPPHVREIPSLISTPTTQLIRDFDQWEPPLSEPSTVIRAPVAQTKPVVRKADACDLACQLCLGCRKQHKYEFAGGIFLPPSDSRVHPQPYHTIVKNLSNLLVSDVQNQIYIWYTGQSIESSHLACISEYLTLLRYKCLATVSNLKAQQKKLDSKKYKVTKELPRRAQIVFSVADNALRMSTELHDGSQIIVPAVDGYFHDLEMMLVLRRTSIVYGDVHLIAQYGVPGAGKTYTIKKLQEKHRARVVVATKSCREQFKTSAKTYSAHTADSVIMHMRSDRAKVLLIDESCMMHAGQILLISKGIVQNDVTVLYGDPKQITYISRTSEFPTSFSLLPDIDVSPMSVSYRCPSDVINIIADQYDFDVTTTNDISHSIEITTRALGVVGSNDLVLTFLQDSKHDLERRLDHKVLTVHEAQGMTADVVHLVSKEISVPGICKSDTISPHVLTAISRHRRRLVVYLRTEDHPVAKLFYAARTKGIKSRYNPNPATSMLDIDAAVAAVRDNPTLTPEVPVPPVLSLMRCATLRSSVKPMSKSSAQKVVDAVSKCPSQYLSPFVAGYFDVMDLLPHHTLQELFAASRTLPGTLSLKKCPLTGRVLVAHHAGSVSDKVEFDGCGADVYADLSVAEYNAAQNPQDHNDCYLDCHIYVGNQPADLKPGARRIYWEPASGIYVRVDGSLCAAYHPSLERDTPTPLDSPDLTVYNRIASNKAPTYNTTNYQKQDAGYLFFFGGSSSLSNHHAVTLAYDGKLDFRSSEQMYFYFCAEKCKLGGGEILSKAMSARHALEIFREHYPKKLPAHVRQRVMRFVLDRKFAEPHMRDALLKTYPLYLVECNPSDTFWGSGFTVKDATATAMDNIKGYNVLGRMLMDIRKRLIGALCPHTKLRVVGPLRPNIQDGVDLSSGDLTPAYLAAKYDGVDHPSIADLVWDHGDPPSLDRTYLYKLLRTKGLAADRLPDIEVMPPSPVDVAASANGFSLKHHSATSAITVVAPKKHIMHVQKTLKYLTSCTGFLVDHCGQLSFALPAAVNAMQMHYRFCTSCPSSSYGHERNYVPIAVDKHPLSRSVDATRKLLSEKGIDGDPHPDWERVAKNFDHDRMFEGLEAVDIWPETMWGQPTQQSSVSEQTMKLTERLIPGNTAGITEPVPSTYAQVVSQGTNLQDTTTSAQPVTVASALLDDVVQNFSQPLAAALLKSKGLTVANVKSSADDCFYVSVGHHIRREPKVLRRQLIEYMRISLHGRQSFDSVDDWEQYLSRHRTSAWADTPQVIAMSKMLHMPIYITRLNTPVGQSPYLSHTVAGLNYIAPPIHVALASQHYVPLQSDGTLFEVTDVLEALGSVPVSADYHSYTTSQRQSVPVIQGDIAYANTDVMVNAANSALAWGGGVAGAIHSRVGHQLDVELSVAKDGQAVVPVTSATITTAPGLEARYLVHAVAPQAGYHRPHFGLYLTYVNVFRKADSLLPTQSKVKVAIPFLGAGFFGLHMGMSYDALVAAATLFPRLDITIYTDKPTSFVSYRNIVFINDLPAIYERVLCGTTIVPDESLVATMTSGTSTVSHDVVDAGDMMTSAIEQGIVLASFEDDHQVTTPIVSESTLHMDIKPQIHVPIQSTTGSSQPTTPVDVSSMTIDASPEIINTTDAGPPATQELPECTICMNARADTAVVCVHKFCVSCIAAIRQTSNKCPICSQRWGQPPVGNMPKGKMTVTTSADSLPGHPGVGTIVVDYQVPGGDDELHGQFAALKRTAYFPDETPFSDKLIPALRRLFELRRTFTVSVSHTTGRVGLVWNDVHHKTSVQRDHPHGYPCPGYAAQLLQELTDAGVMTTDLTSAGSPASLLQSAIIAESPRSKNVRLNDICDRVTDLLEQDHKQAKKHRKAILTQLTNVLSTPTTLTVDLFVLYHEGYLQPITTMSVEGTYKRSVEAVFDIVQFSSNIQVEVNTYAVDPVGRELYDQPITVVDKVEQLPPVSSSQLFIDHDAIDSKELLRLHLPDTVVSVICRTTAIDTARMRTYIRRMQASFKSVTVHRLADTTPYDMVVYVVANNKVTSVSDNRYEDFFEDITLAVESTYRQCVADVARVVDYVVARKPDDYVVRRIRSIAERQVDCGEQLPARETRITFNVGSDLASHNTVDSPQQRSDGQSGTVLSDVVAKHGDDQSHTVDSHELLLSVAEQSRDHVGRDLHLCASDDIPGGVVESPPPNLECDMQVISNCSSTNTDTHERPGIIVAGPTCDSLHVGAIDTTSPARAANATADTQLSVADGQSWADLLARQEQSVVDSKVDGNVAITSTFSSEVPNSGLCDKKPKSLLSTADMQSELRKSNVAIIEKYYGKRAHYSSKPRRTLTAMGKTAIYHLRVDSSVGLDADNSIALAALMQLHNLRKYTVWDFLENVVQNSKVRFKLFDKQDGVYVAAVQGHLIKASDKHLVSITERDVARVFHGTSRESYGLIVKSGLSRMGRQHIHFTRADDHAAIQLLRSTSEALVEVDVAMARRMDIQFYVAENGTVLSPGDHLGYIPVSCLSLHALHTEVELPAVRTVIPVAPSDVVAEVSNYDHHAVVVPRTETVIQSTVDVIPASDLQSRDTVVSSTKSSAPSEKYSHKPDVTNSLNNVLLGQHLEPVHMTEVSQPSVPSQLIGEPDGLTAKSAIVDHHPEDTAVITTKSHQLPVAVAVDLDVECMVDQIVDYRDLIDLRAVITGRIAKNRARWDRYSSRVERIQLLKRELNDGTRYITRAYVKMHQMLPRLPVAANASVLLLCESPGGFYQAIVDNRPDVRCIATSLNPMQDAVDVVLDGTYMQFQHNWDFGHDLTGDIYSPSLQQSLATQGPYDFITADGGVNFTNYDEIEKTMFSLVKQQIRVATNMLRDGGSLLVKFLGLLTAATQGLLADTAVKFSRVRLLKPTASRISNDEVYVLFEGFRQPSTASACVGLSEFIEQQHTRQMVAINRILLDQSHDHFNSGESIDALRTVLSRVKHHRLQMTTIDEMQFSSTLLLSPDKYKLLPLETDECHFRNAVPDAVTLPNMQAVCDSFQLSGGDRDLTRQAVKVYRGDLDSLWITKPIVDSHTFFTILCSVYKAMVVTTYGPTIHVCLYGHRRPALTHFMFTSVPLIHCCLWIDRCLPHVTKIEITDSMQRSHLDGDVYIAPAALRAQGQVLTPEAFQLRDGILWWVRGRPNSPDDLTAQLSIIAYDECYVSACNESVHRVRYIGAMSAQLAEQYGVIYISPLLVCTTQCYAAFRSLWNGSKKFLVTDTFADVMNHAADVNPPTRKLTLKHLPCVNPVVQLASKLQSGFVQGHLQHIIENYVNDDKFVRAVMLLMLIHAPIVNRNKGARAVRLVNQLMTIFSNYRGSLSVESIIYASIPSDRVLHECYPSDISTLDLVVNSHYDEIHYTNSVHYQDNVWTIHIASEDFADKVREFVGRLRNVLNYGTVIINIYSSVAVSVESNSTPVLPRLLYSTDCIKRVVGLTTKVQQLSPHRACWVEIAYQLLLRVNLRLSLDVVSSFGTYTADPVKVANDIVVWLDAPVRTFSWRGAAEYAAMNVLYDEQNSHFGTGVQKTVYYGSCYVESVIPSQSSLQFIAQRSPVAPVVLYAPCGISASDTILADDYCVRVIDDVSSVRSTDATYVSVKPTTVRQFVDFVALRPPNTMVAVPYSVYKYAAGAQYFVPDDYANHGQLVAISGNLSRLEDYCDACINYRLIATTCQPVYAGSAYTRFYRPSQLAVLPADALYPIVEDMQMDLGVVIQPERAPLLQRLAAAHDAVDEPIFRVLYRYPQQLGNDCPDLMESASGAVETLQILIDTIYPETSLEDASYDSQKVETGDLEVEFGRLKISMSKYDTHKQPKIIHKSRLRGPAAPTRPDTSKNLLTAVYKRNADVISLTDDHNEGILRHVVISSLPKLFRGDYHVLLDEYSSNPIVYNYAKAEAWLEKMEPNKFRLLNSSEITPVNLKGLNEWLLSVKPKLKVSGPEYLSEYVKAQTIVSHDPVITSYFSNIFIQALQRMQQLLRPTVVLAVGNTGANIGDILSFSDFTGTANDIDFSKYDKSQQEMALTIQRDMFVMCGVPQDMADVWFESFRTTFAQSMKHKMSVGIDWQQRSGSAATIVGNSFFCLAVHATILDRNQLDDLLVLGDDSMMHSGPVIVPQQQAMYATLFNLNAKIIRSRAWYFCGHVVVNAGGVITLVPDVIKRAVKLSQALRDMDNIEDQRQSFIDITRPYMSAVTRLVTQDAMVLRYGEAPWISAMNAMAALARSAKHFRALYYQQVL